MKYDKLYPLNTFTGETRKELEDMVDKVRAETIKEMEGALPLESYTQLPDSVGSICELPGDKIRNDLLKEIKLALNQLKI